MWEWYSVNVFWIILITGISLIILLTIFQRIHDHNEKLSANRQSNKVDRSAHYAIWTVIIISLIIVSAGIISIVLSKEGIRDLINSETIQKWILDHGLFILALTFVTYLFHPLAKLVVPKLTKGAVVFRGKGRHTQEELTIRAQTLNQLLISVIDIFIITVAVLIIISEIGVQIAPLLAGAGIFAVAIGFGAQSVVKDILRGFIIIVQDQYNRGDWIEICGVMGFVQDMSLFRTVIRDLDGTYHSIPNGEITTSSNYTKEWSRVNLNISVAYKENIDHVIEVINRVGSELAQDEKYSSFIIHAPEVLRVNNFSDSGIEVKILGDTKPVKQWMVMGELRRRIKNAFDAEGISMAWPHIRIDSGDDQKADS
ncbi:mechanosensitive ion channel family protein [Chloroflexota bacterium]